MELLRKLSQIILTQIGILSFLIVAPALYLVIPFVLIAGNATQSDLGGVALVYMAAGPFVSAFWTTIVCMVRRVRRMTSDGRPYERTWGGTFAAFGWMLFGFFGSIVAEVIFFFLFHGVSKSPLAFFAIAPFATFAPLIMVWLHDRRRRGMRKAKTTSAETLAIRRNFAEADAVAQSLRREGQDERPSSRPSLQTSTRR
jgi:hypothetical protein